MTFDPYQLSDWGGDNIDFVAVLLCCFSRVTPSFHPSSSYLSQLIYTRSDNFEKVEEGARVRGTTDGQDG